MTSEVSKLAFASDYQAGCHPAIMDKLVRTNLENTSGYGTDAYSERARARIREACGCPDAEVQFLVGGTQVNAVVTDCALPSYAGVVAADTGHVALHEAGAIELTRHKVLTIPGQDGKITADKVRAYVRQFFADENRSHMVQPGMVYLSQPSEYGTLYSLAELEDMRAACDELGLLLYVDGARLAYALSCPNNDVTLKDMARLCDVFYIGGTKCGALFGEAVVIPDPGLIPHFFTLVKQHGALLAKGRIAGVQFDTLFEDGLYERIGADAIAYADRLRAALVDKGYELQFGSPTNQVFVKMDDKRLAELGRRVEYSFWERADDAHTIIRLATSWSTRAEDVEQLVTLL